LSTIRSPREIELLAKAGKIVYETHQYLKQYIKPGITTKELDELAENFIISKGAKPSFKGYMGYPATLCTSVNEEIVHGIPSNYKLKNGDIVSIDIGAEWCGYHGDSAWTYAVGDITTEKAYLMEHTEKALFEGLNAIKPGNRIGDIGNAIEVYAHRHKLGIAENLVGHGVGTSVHEEPDVPNFGIKGKGPLLKPGMVIAVEPMLNLGTSKIEVLDDEWTIVTLDGKPSAHFEHTVVVTEESYKILTGV